tara:strand:+ start:10927 stop:11532 length:606 start_codon:yes stop_codon:yes gene_type:complete
MRKDITISKLAKAMNRLGYSVFETDTKAYNLNIVGVRSSNPIVNEFNDLMCVFWKYEGNWNIYKMQMTSLPGVYWLANPSNPLGCAILKEGQYKGVYKIDKHSGKYDALCQRLGNVTVYRDDNRDRNYDEISGTEDTGMFGINIHKAHADYELETVDKWSAGCQVIQDPDEYEIHMDVVKKSAEIWGNKFTYTLINENDLN